MSATKKSVATVSPMVAEHAALCEKRNQSGLSAGVAASLTRQLRTLELEARLSQVDLKVWAPRTASKSHDLTPEQLTARIAAVATVVNDDTAPQSTRKTATAMLAKLTDEATARGVDIPNA
jgi:hypothetical protein